MKRICLLLAALVLTISLQAQEFDKKPPVFASASKESVSLRYRHTLGQKTGQSVSMIMNMEIDMGEKDQKMSVNMNMKMTGSYTVEKINPDGTVVIAYAIGRMVISASSPVEMTYDSDDQENALPEFAKMKYYLNAPILMTIDARGKMLSFDTTGIESAMKDSGEEASAAEIRSQVENFTKNTFMPLPDRPVKKGDVFDAGIINQDIQGMGALTFNTRYQVSAVSGDKKKAVLEPLVKMALTGQDMSKSTMSGWLLFDIEKGTVERSYVILRLDLPFAQGGANARITSDSEIFFRTE